jgi:hypothetical protein
MTSLPVNGVASVALVDSGYMLQIRKRTMSPAGYIRIQINALEVINERAVYHGAIRHYWCYLGSGTSDFFEYLEEQGYEDTMTSDELIIELQDYIRTECEKI